MSWRSRIFAKHGGIDTHSEARVAGHGTTQAIIDLIAMGMCKDEVIEDHVAMLARSATQEQRYSAARQIADIALASKNMKAVACALKALKSLLPLDPGLENALDKRILALVDGGSAAENDVLAEAIAVFIYRRAKERASAAQPYIPALLSFLAQKMETTGASSYYSLMIVVNDAPACFEPYMDTLVRMLDRPGIPTRIFAMRIIAGLASTHPEYVIDARDALRDMAETSPQELVKAEAAKAYLIVRDIDGTPRGYGSRRRDDPAIASLNQMPVWQQAVEHHLSVAYGSDLRSGDRQHGRHPGTKRDSGPSKRSNMYQEFVAKRKQGESAQSFEERIALVSQEASAETVPVEMTSVEAAIRSQPPVVEMSQPVMNETRVKAPLAEDILPDSAEAVYLQEMMNEVQNDFSSTAGSLLDALGMGHMKRGGKGEDGNYKISGKEFVFALEKLVREHKSKVR